MPGAWACSLTRPEEGTATCPKTKPNAAPERKDFYCQRAGKQQLKLKTLDPQRWVAPRQSRILGKGARRILLDYSRKRLESALSGG